MNMKFRKACKFLVFSFLPIFLFSLSSFAQDENFSKVKEDDFVCKVNCCFSIGQNCKTAYHIKRHKKRFQACPLDWMRDYSLDTCIHLFKTKFSDFFEEIEEKEIQYNCDRNIDEKHVKDTKNNILSLHHFSAYNPLEEEHQKFRKIMLNRADKVDKILSSSESIALIYSQEYIETAMPENQEFIEFLKSFSEIYPNKKIYLILTEIKAIEGIQKEVVFKEDNLKITKFYFWDYNDSWTGNHELWNEVMSYIKLV